MTPPLNPIKRLAKGDKWIPWSFVAMFGVILIANGTMMFFAFTTWNGMATNDSYRRGLAYNQSLKEKEAQAQMGWKMASGFRSTGRLAGEVRLRMTDRTGQPLSGATIVALVRRPVTKGSDFKLHFNHVGNGRYRSRASFPFPGQWELRYQVDHAGRRFQAQQRITVN